MTLDMTWEHREEIIRRDERAEGKEEGRLEQRRADEILLEAKDSEITTLYDSIEAKDAEIARLRALLDSKG